MSESKAIFLDRDGVINKLLINDYVKNIEEFEILPKVKEALVKFKESGYLNIIITNQDGVGRGVMSEEDLIKIHEYIIKKLPEMNDIFYCTGHKNKDKNCMKPSPYMI